MQRLLNFESIFMQAQQVVFQLCKTFLFDYVILIMSKHLKFPSHFFLSLIHALNTFPQLPWSESCNNISQYSSKLKCDLYSVDFCILEGIKSFFEQSVTVFLCSSYFHYNFCCCVLVNNLVLSFIVNNYILIYVFGLCPWLFLRFLLDLDLLNTVILDHEGWYFRFVKEQRLFVESWSFKLDIGLHVFFVVWDKSFKRESLLHSGGTRTTSSQIGHFKFII